MRGTALRSPVALLALILAGHVLAWSLHPFAFLDDLDSQHYARLAAEMLAGKFTLAPHTFNCRFGVTVPTAAVYGILGIGPRTTTLWPLVASLLTIVVVFATTYRAFGRSAALLAALLLATNVTQVEYAAHLLPDIIVSGLMLGSAALLCAARDAHGGAASRPWLHGGLCAVALVAALLTKETVVWALPFFLGVLAYDLARRRNVRVWTAIVATGAVCLGLFFLSYYLTTGNPLHALDSVEEKHNVSVQASFAGKSSAQYLHRLTLAPIQFLVDQLGYGYLVLLAVPALIHMVRPLRSLPSGVRLWTAYAAVLLLCFWFGTTSLRSYNPLPISPRFLMPLLAPLSILGGVTLARFLSGDKHEHSARVGMLLTAAAFVAAGAALLPSRPARSAMYGVLGLALAFLASPVRHFLRGRLAKVTRLAIIAVLSLGILVYYGSRGGVKEPNSLRVIERDFIQRHVARLPEDAVVFTDEHSAFVLPLLLERNGASRVRVADWSDAAAVRAHAGVPAFVFVDQTTLSMMNEWLGREIPSFAREPPPHWQRLASAATLWRGGSDLFRDGQQILLLEIDDPTELLLR